MAKAIPPKLEQEVVSKSAEGWSTRQISRWLKEEHGVKASHVAVAALLLKGKPEREAIAREVVREKIASSVGKDLDRLEKHAARLDKMATKYADSADEGVDFARKGGRDGSIFVEHGEQYAKLVEQLRKVTETKLSHAGLAGADRNGLPALQAEKIKAETAILQKRLELIQQGKEPAEPTIEEEQARLDELRKQYPELRDIVDEAHGENA